MQEITVYWFRRDLRIDDNHALFMALNDNIPVLPLFIFDINITSALPPNDARLFFIYNSLQKLQEYFLKKGSSLLIKKGAPETIWKELVEQYSIKKVYVNTDYEPYAIKRDRKIETFLKSKSILFKTFKDQVLFEKNEILNDKGLPYTKFTPYKNKWLTLFSTEMNLPDYTFLKKERFIPHKTVFPTLNDVSIKPSAKIVQQFRMETVPLYAKSRDFPASDSTSLLGPHLRFGTISIRKLIKKVHSSPVFLNELIWRSFFMQILYHFPHVQQTSFNPKYANIKWLNDDIEFEKWKHGKTGYPLVDAGMRQLLKTGYMHNRVRMVCASFLCKHLLIDWQLGAEWFALNLLDYDLAANNGNWQWAAGTGCDAVPYFRIFNPYLQQKKFDPNFTYIKKWLPEFGTESYPKPIIEHTYARKRALFHYKKFSGQ